MNFYLNTKLLIDQDITETSGGYSRLYDYFEELIHRVLSKHEYKLTYNDLKISIDFNSYVEYTEMRDYGFDASIWIGVESEITDDNDAICEIVERDTKLQEFIYQKAIEFLNEANDIIKGINYPYDCYEVLFYGGKLYVSVLDATENIKFKSIRYDTNLDKDELLDYL